MLLRRRSSCLLQQNLGVKLKKSKQYPSQETILTANDGRIRIRNQREDKIARRAGNRKTVANAKKCTSVSQMREDKTTKQDLR